MITKPFNQSTHDACDPPARKAVSQYIKNTWGMNAEHNPNQYAVDLIIYDQSYNPTGYAEIEMRDWHDCPFPTIHIPQRKKKLFDNDMKTIYFVVSKGLNRTWYIDVRMILNSPLVEIANKDVSQGEYFYDVSKYLFTEASL